MVRTITYRPNPLGAANRALELAISSAAHDASVTCSKWGSPVNHENRAEGGYHFQTYKAICRRNGVYSNFTGKHDFNMELLV